MQMSRTSQILMEKNPMSMDSGKSLIYCNFAFFKENDGAENQATGFSELQAARYKI